MLKALYICVYIYIYIHTRARARTHTHTHTKYMYLPISISTMWHKVIFLKQSLNWVFLFLGVKAMKRYSTPPELSMIQISVICKTPPLQEICLVSWGCRIHWLHLCRGVRPPPLNECPRYDTKQSDGEVPAVLELWGMRSTPSLPSLPGPLWPGVVAPDRALSMG